MANGGGDAADDVETHFTVTYPPEPLHEEWEAAADSMDMSLSEWIQAMVAAGRKKFDADVTLDETTEELRRERNHLARELERARERAAELEEFAGHRERTAIVEFVADNPGATFGEIVQHLVDTVPERATAHLDGLTGDAIERGPDGGYYPADETDGDDTDADGGSQ